MEGYAASEATSPYISSIDSRVSRVGSRNQTHTQSRANAQSKPSDVDKRSGSLDRSDAGDINSGTKNDSYSPNPSAVNSNKHHFISLPGVSRSTGSITGGHQPSRQQPLLPSAENETGQEQNRTVTNEELSTRALRTLLSRFEEMQQLVGDAKQEMHNLTRIQQTMQVKLLVDKNAKLEATLKSTMVAHAEEIDRYAKKYEDLKLSEENYKTKYDEVNQELADTKREFERKESTLSAENQLQQMELTRTKKELEKVKAELSESNTRLSRQMGNKLTENNPQIADLSDSNRPSKLAEKHSELYDNEWTNAFEELEHACGDEQKAIQKLLDILMDVNEFCKVKSVEQSLQLKQVACMSNTAMGQIPDTPELKKQTKEFRKYTAELSIQAVCKEYAWKTQAKNREFFANPEVCKYIAECVKLCWLMNTHDPSVVFAPAAAPDTDFDTNLYKYYTKSGSEVQYIVWPALLLHEGGAILMRGTAQGHSVRRNSSRTSTYESTRPTSSRNSQAVKDDAYGNRPVVREVWGTGNQKPHQLTPEKSYAQNVYGSGNNAMNTVFNEGRDASLGQSRFAEQKSQKGPDSYQQSAQFPATEDGNYRRENDMSRDMASQSTTRNKGSVTDPCGDLVKEFDGQTSMQTNMSGSMHTKPSEQPTTRWQTSSSSVNVPITRSTDIPSDNEMSRFLKYIEYGKSTCRTLLGDTVYKKCVKYYNEVLVNRITY